MRRCNYGSCLINKGFHLPQMQVTMRETTEEKSEKSRKLSPVEPKKTHSKPPFKSCFVLREELGRSYILPSRPKKIACE